MPLLLAAFSLGADVQASTSTKAKNNSQKTSVKKTATTSPASKTAATKKRTSSRTAAKSRQRQAAQSKLRIAPRKNLHKASQSGIRVALRHDGDDVESRHTPAHCDAKALGAHTLLRSEVAFVQDLESSVILYDKNSDEVRPIASISKLMTAIVVAEARQPMNEKLKINEADIDRVRHSRSRLRVGTELSRADMLHLALMSSENRAAHALARYYPGGIPAFVRAMNDKARSLGMRKTRFVEPTGLSSDNVSSSRDLVKLLRAADKHPLIHRYTTDDTEEIKLGNGRQLVYNNSNRLVRNSNWDIAISKTGFINEAGECLVMLTRIDNRKVAIVLLNSTGRYSRIGDAVRIRSLVENGSSVAML